MSHKVKRKTYSESSSFKRWLLKLSDAKPSSLVITIILFSYLVFLFGGGLYSIVNPIFPPYINNNFIFVYPDLGSQFISETIIAATLYSMGFAGILFLYQSTKHVYRARQAYISAILGVALILVAYFFLEYILFMKIS